MIATPALLFVCLGNICRSPLAEAVFRREAERAGLDVTVDSAGTGGWHEGEPPDRRAIAVARRQGLDISGLRARKLRADDYHRFTHILALDRSNLRDIESRRPADAMASVSLLLDHVAGQQGQSVADPYYGSEEDFGQTFEEVTLAAKALVVEFGVRSGG